MADIIASVVIIAILAGAVAYIVRAKKKGVKCIGCPSSGRCGKKAGENDGGSCSCGCK